MHDSRALGTIDFERPRPHRLKLGLAFLVAIVCAMNTQTAQSEKEPEPTEAELLSCAKAEDQLRASLKGAWKARDDCNCSVLSAQWDSLSRSIRQAMDALEDQEARCRDLKRRAYGSGFAPSTLKHPELERRYSGAVQRAIGQWYADIINPIGRSTVLELMSLFPKNEFWRTAQHWRGVRKMMREAAARSRETWDNSEDYV